MVVSRDLVEHTLVGTRRVVQIVLWMPEQFALISGTSRLLVVLPIGAGLITWSNLGFEFCLIQSTQQSTIYIHKGMVLLRNGTRDLVSMSLSTFIGLVLYCLVLSQATDKS
jgi:hypothetical protein